MKDIKDIVNENKNKVMQSIIDWLDYTDENLNSVFKEIVDICEADHTKRYKVNILVIAKEKKSKLEIDKFKGEYKLMASEVIIYWSSNSGRINGVPKVEFAPKNITGPSIIKFVPMQDALPKNL